MLAQVKAEKKTKRWDDLGKGTRVSSLFLPPEFGHMRPTKRIPFSSIAGSSKPNKAKLLKVMKLPIGTGSASKRHRQQRISYKYSPLVCLVEPNPLLRPILLNKFRTSQKIRACLLEATAFLNRMLCPDVFILDRGTLGTRFHSYLSQIVMQFPNTRIAVLDGPLELADQSLLIKIGVHGFLPYSSLDKHFVSLVTALMGGKLWFKPSVLTYHIQAHATTSLGADGGLTHRQREILSLVKQGLINKEISAQLGISESTVKFHLAKMFNKFGIHNKRGLVSHFETMQRATG
jgi:DNA-binding NarL/FixJ family response regulator